MKRLLAFGLVLTIAVAWAAPVEAKDPKPKASVQVALLLDTSNSMDGLIAQAKTQLWSVVNEFIRAKVDGRPPTIEVALYEYGNDGLPAEEGHVRLVLPFTDDLDAVSEQLFALKTNGGQEYCGTVIRDALNQLQWSGSTGVYKAIFIAGNEPFSQGSVDFRESCRAAIEKGVLVNTIFCGPLAEGESTGWKDGAVLADGQFMSIDQNQQVVAIPAPQDTELAQLGTSLNKTYLPYGRLGMEGQKRQWAQDANAAQASPNAAVTRSISKGCAALYCSDEWDLVDAIKNGKCKLEEMKDEDLPEGFQKLTLAERKARVEAAGKDRESIQKKIMELSAERERFLATERAKRAAEDQDTLDAAIVKAVRAQAARANLRFEEAMGRKRVLVIEDDGAIRRGVLDALAFAGFETLEATEGIGGRAAALDADYDVLLLDLVLPGCDGLQILQAVRASRPALPVIVVTARGSEDDRVLGLDLGADDYLIKPFSVRELLARIEAVMRRSPERTAPVRHLRLSTCLADLDRREIVYSDGKRCELSEREGQLLAYLALHSERAVSRDEILARVWGLDPRGVTTRTIDMHVARLREKLLDDSEQPRVVLTVRGRGYMLAPGVAVQ